jgi:putative flippase GtrA
MRAGVRAVWRRVWRFLFVGGLGIVVQLAALAGLVGLGCQYLLATGVAVEAAVLHNFVWHQRFTWADRKNAKTREVAIRLLRFHVSNGLISIGGSLILMRWMVGELGMHLIAANLATIAACSVANFVASDRWVFVPSGELAVGGQSW